MKCPYCLNQDLEESVNNNYDMFCRRYSYGKCATSHFSITEDGFIKNCRFSNVYTAKPNSVKFYGRIEYTHLELGVRKKCDGLDIFYFEIEPVKSSDIKNFIDVQVNYFISKILENRVLE